MTTKAVKKVTVKKSTRNKVKKVVTGFDQKFQNFLHALVKTYGKGAQISYAQAAQVYESGDYALWRNYAKNRAYKVSRGILRVTDQVLALKNTKGHFVNRV